MTAAASAVHAVNPELLKFFSGMSFDTYIDAIPLGKSLNGTNGTSTAGKTAIFDPSDFGWEDKAVLEIHKYDFEATKDNCSTFKSKWYEQGFQALDVSNSETKFFFPMVLSEWGFHSEWNLFRPNNVQ